MNLDNVGIEDIQTFFSNQVVRYKGAPVYVKAIGQGRSFKIKHLLSGDELLVPRAYKDITLDNLRVGLVNTVKGAAWVSRYPMRKMNMGLSVNNLVSPHVRINEILTSHELGLTLEGRYPSFEEALESYMETDLSVAFSRHFWIGDKKRLWYKDKAVGVLRGGDCILKEEAKHLSDLLELAKSGKET